MTETQLRVVQEIIYQEGRSFLRYTVDADPIIHSTQRQSWGNIASNAQKEFGLLDKLLEHFAKLKLRPPALGDYPMTFTNYHFVTLKTLFPLLIENHNKALSFLNVNLPQLPEDWQKLVGQLVEVKKQTLEYLFAKPIAVTG